VPQTTVIDTGEKMSEIHVIIYSKFKTYYMLKFLTYGSLQSK
jgi:hypothetical protein